MESEAIEWFGRFSGPLHFRFILQPAIAALFGYRDGVRDAADGAPPYLRSLIGAEPGQRSLRIRDGWESIGKVFIIAAVLDGLFQYLVSGHVAILGAVVVAIVLAIVPYLLFRGAVNRWKQRHQPRP